MRQTKIGLILAITSLLAACGDSSVPSSAAAPAEKSQPAAAVKQDQLGEKRSLIREFPALPLSERQQYKDSMIPLVLVDVYHALRGTDESDTDIADSMGGELNYEGFPRDLVELVSRYSNAADAFQKRDLGKELATAVLNRNIGETDRYLRVDFTGQEISLGTYDFNRKGFPVDATLFIPEKSEMPSSWALTSLNPYNQPRVRSYVAIPPIGYKLGFDKSEDIAFLKVEDEAVARVIESNRASVKVTVYGSVVRVFRDYEFRSNPIKPLANRYVIMQPQRVDLVDATGKLVFTVEL